MNVILRSVLILILAAPFTLSGQTLDEAKELYKVGAYSRALPVFQKEYEAKPTDASLNQWYGVCLYETRTDVKKAEECIEFAASKNVQEAFIYLGKIYTENYRFADAEKQFKRYAQLKRRDKEALARLEIEEDRLDMLKKATRHTEDIQIIDSLVVDKRNFLSAYKLNPGSGSLTYYDDFFKSGSHANTVYINEKETKIYYARDTDSGVTGLFSMEKLMDGFGNEKKLSTNDFGLSGNLNFPFVLTDGVTIYFSAADDEEGFGGYDIYVTRYNMNNDTYLTPQRLNMPFNSTFNDYMMAVDEEKGIGWFATDRFQPEGKVCIYTYIPNEQVDIVEGEDENYLIKRALITSIKDSHKNGKNYSELLALARTVNEKKASAEGDFYFVIDDRYTYRKWSDFKNSPAKDLYKKAYELKQELNETVLRLNGLRVAFAENSTGINRNDLLSLEKKETDLVERINDLELKARNMEIGSLK